METQETQEPGAREVRGGRPPKTVLLVANLTVADMETLARAQMKKMRQTFEDVPRERILSEAIQLYAKSLNAGE